MAKGESANTVAQNSSIEATVNLEPLREALKAAAGKGNHYMSSKAEDQSGNAWCAHGLEVLLPVGAGGATKTTHDEAQGNVIDAILEELLADVDGVDTAITPRDHCCHDSVQL